MHFKPQHRVLPACDTISPRDLTAVLTNARALQGAAQAGVAQALLRGRNLGLLCELYSGDDSVLFRRAAVELGAQVAHIRTSLSTLSTTQEVRHIACMLGRLYEAVECQGMDSALVMRIERDAGIPVYDAIASPEHPTAKLAMLLGGDASSVEKRRLVVQAVLLTTIA